MSPVTCHQRQQQQPQTLPLLTLPLCTVVKKYLDLNFTFFSLFLKSLNNTCVSVKNLTLLYQESVMALRRNLSWL